MTLRFFPSLKSHEPVRNLSLDRKIIGVFPFIFFVISMAYYFNRKTEMLTFLVLRKQTEDGIKARKTDRSDLRKNFKLTCVSNNLERG